MQPTLASKPCRKSYGFVTETGIFALCTGRGAQPQERVVERPYERGSIAVPQRRDERPPHGVLGSRRCLLTCELLSRLSLADGDAPLAEALDRWELSLFQNEPFRSEQLRGALAGLLGDTWELRAAVLLGDASDERRAIHASLRALASGKQASERAEDAVRRSLVETLRHGDRPALVRSLDDVLLGLRSAPRLAHSA